MAVGAKHKANVGDVEARHGAEVSALMRELLAAGSAALGVPEAPGAVARLNAYARSVAHFPTAVKEVRAAPPSDGGDGRRRAHACCLRGTAQGDAVASARRRSLAATRAATAMDPSLHRALPPPHH